MERSFFDVFNNLDDPRSQKGLKYPLTDVIILAIYGILCGYTDFVNMSYYLKKRENELTESLGLSNGIPSHDVFSDVFRAIDVEKFMDAFVEWTRIIAKARTGKHIAIDGKAVRAATEKCKGGNIPYVVSAFLCGSGLSIGQKEVGAKTNEITEIPRLLDLIDIKGSIITIDAIGTQTDIMNKIVKNGGDFCLQLKGNQKTTYENVRLLFQDMKENEPDRFKELPCFEEKVKDHGRIEARKYVVFDDLEEIRNVIPESWDKVKCIGMAILVRGKGDTKSTEIHFHVMSKMVGAEEYASLARGHWAIENSLHWVLDIHFCEDRSTARADNAISNLTLLRKIVFNLTKLDPEMAKKTTKKRMIDFMTDIEVFKRLIFEILPESDV